MNFKHNKIYVALLIGIVLFILGWVVFMTYQNKSFVYTLLNHYDLLPKKESYTELYFENSAFIPEEVEPRDVVSFSFTVHTVGDARADEPYVVYFETGDGYVDTIDRGTLHLGDGEYKTITETYTFTEKTSAGRIVVELPGLNQTIHFLIR